LEIRKGRLYSLKGDLIHRIRVRVRVIVRVRVRVRVREAIFSERRPNPSKRPPVR